MSYANKTGIPYLVAKNDDFKKFKTHGGSIFLVMKPTETSEKRVVFSNGRYDNGSSPIWITSGGSTVSSEGSNSVPAQLRFAFDQASNAAVSGTVSFSVNANGNGLKYYSITFTNLANANSTSFNTTNNGETLANAYTAIIDTSGSTQAQVIEDLRVLFSGSTNQFPSSSWTFSKVTSQQPGMSGANTQLNITGPNGNTAFNISNLTENISGMAVEKADAQAGSNSESGTASISINGEGKSSAISTSSYDLFEFVFPGLTEDISSMSAEDSRLRHGIFKNGIQISELYPDSESWGTKSSQDDDTIYICPPVSSTNFFKGEIASVMIFTENLTVSSRQKVEWYHSEYFDITLDSNHPHFSTDPTTTVSLDFSPKQDPDKLFAWYDPTTLEDDGYGNVRWKDQHHLYNTNNNDVRHLNPLRNFTTYQPNPVSSEIASSVISSSDILSNAINGQKALRIRPSKGLAFYGFLNTTALQGFTAFVVVKYNEAENNSEGDYYNSEAGSVIEISNLFHNTSNSSPKTNYHISISDSIDGYAEGGYDNNIETVYLDGQSNIRQERSSVLAEDDSIVSDAFQVISIVSRNSSGSNTRESGVYLNGVSKGSSEASSFDVDTVVISGGSHDITVAEILLYKEELSDEERQKIEGYLAHKFSLQSKFSNSHPYKSFAPEIDRELRPTVKTLRSLSSNWSPKSVNNLIGLYTPDNILFEEDHFGNSCSLKAAPVINNDSQNRNAVAGIIFEEEKDEVYKVHSSEENLSYEVLVSNQSISEQSTSEKVDAAYQAIKAIVAGLE